MEWLVAAEHNVSVVCIVENNGMHGISHHASKRIDGEPMDCLSLSQPVEIAGIATAMGLRARQVNAPGQIADVYLEALEWDGPTIIEVIVDAKEAPPMEDRAELIAGFQK
jgi:thiamine pyrophosphate-dependent acetolactate synthase large subunit-like protein